MGQKDVLNSSANQGQVVVASYSVGDRKSFFLVGTKLAELRSGNTPNTRTVAKNLTAFVRLSVLEFEEQGYGTHGRTLSG